MESANMALWRAAGGTDVSEIVERGSRVTDWRTATDQNTAFYRVDATATFLD